jgi:hypothetical protein
MADEAARTQAVVVGVERYDVNSRWDLPGPVSDALRFTAWLRRHEVPAQNIRLLLSPLSEPIAPAGILDVAVVAATLTNVRAALTGLAAAAGGKEQRLLIFWGGHGVMTGDRRRQVFCTDISKYDAPSLDVESLLQMLRTGERRVFTRQLLLFDVCANFFERSNLPVSESTFAAGEEDKNVQQVALFAAAAGQRASNDTVRRTGAFSSTVLDFLEQQGNVFPPDAEALGRHVTAHFDRLRTSGDLDQTPTRFSATGLAAGDALLGEIPAPERLRQATGRANLSVRLLRRFATRLQEANILIGSTDRDRLAAALPANVQLLITRHPSDAVDDLAGIAAACGSDDELDALKAAIEAIEQDPINRIRAGAAVERLRVAAQLRPWLSSRVLGGRDLHRIYVLSAPDPFAAPAVVETDEMIDELAQMRPRLETSARPLTEFVGRVARALEADGRAGAAAATMKLRTWIDASESEDKIVELERMLDAQTAAETLAPNYLLIDLGDEAAAHIEYWVYSPDPLRGQHGFIDKPAPAPLQSGVGRSSATVSDGIKLAVAELINRIADEVLGELRVELFVTMSQLGADVDRWPLEPDDEDITIGLRFVTALRWRERALRLKRDAARTWRWVADEISRVQNLETIWLDHQESDKAVGVRVSSRTQPYVCVSFGFVPIPAETRAPSGQLRAALTGGMPYGVWVRNQPANWESFRTAIDNLLLVSRFDTLPRELQRLRAAAAQSSDTAHAGHNLTLFWDDPARNPLDQQFHSP